MLTESEIQAIMFLLDDPDEEVVKTVEQRLYSEGPDIVPLLEDVWTANSDPLKAFRLETIIRNIQHNQLASEFRNWMGRGGQGLYKGSELVCRIQYPGLNSETLNAYFEKLRLDAWMAMYNAYNPLDKIQILNHILFERQGLSGNTENYHAPENSFLNKVIETRNGNPISLCIIYSIVAQRLGLPVFGVNLPQHFILAYCDDKDKEVSGSFLSRGELRRSDFGKVLFYINPFSSGQIFLRKNIDEFLKAIKVAPQDSFYNPCSNLEIIRRVLRNLHFSYQENHNQEKVKTVAAYMNILGMTNEGTDHLLDEGS